LKIDDKPYASGYKSLTAFIAAGFIILLVSVIFFNIQLCAGCGFCCYKNKLLGKKKDWKRVIITYAVMGTIIGLI